MKKLMPAITSALLIASPLVAFAQAQVVDIASPRNPSAAELAFAMFDQAVSSATVPGISAAIADKDGIIWAKGFGWADIENRVPMATETKMRVGSVAKPLTAAALMRLFDKGKLDLDVDIRTYVPAWPKKHATLTLRQLSSHTAGVRHYESDEFQLNRHYDTVVSSLEIFKDDPLKFIPGSDFNYSTYAWTLISAAIEGADGNRDFKTIMQQEVFEPLGMKDSALDDQYEIIPNRQRPYSAREGILRNSPQTDHSYKWAGGGFIASTGDIARFAVAHVGDGFLNKSTADEMFTSARTSSGKVVDYGIGWHIGFDLYKKRFSDDAEAVRIMNEHPNSVMHSGGSMGGTTMMILCRDHGRAVTVVKNVDGDRSANQVLLALRTLDIFHNAPEFSSNNLQTGTSAGNTADGLD